MRITVTECKARDLKAGDLFVSLHQAGPANFDLPFLLAEGVVGARVYIYTGAPAPPEELGDDMLRIEVQREDDLKAKLAQLEDEREHYRRLLQNFCPHASSTGIDQSGGPDKVFRCDCCGLRSDELRPYEREERAFHPQGEEVGK